MEGAPAPPVYRPTSFKFLIRYIKQVEQFYRNIPEVVEVVKSLGPDFESLNLLTQDLDMRYRDLQKAQSLPMFFVRKWAKVSQHRKSQTTRELSPLQHLAAIYETTESLQQKFHRCWDKCVQLGTHVKFLENWRKYIKTKTVKFLLDVKRLSYAKRRIRDKQALLLPHPSSSSQDEACTLDSDSNSDDSSGDSDASVDEFADRDQGEIQSFENVTESLAKKIGVIKECLQLMREHLSCTSSLTTQIALECEHLWANTFSGSLCPKYPRKNKVDPELFKSEPPSLETWLENMKHELARAIESTKRLDRNTERLIKLQGIHQAQFRELLRRTLLIRDHSAAITQMEDDLAALGNPSDKALLEFCNRSMIFLNLFEA